MSDKFLAVMDVDENGTTRLINELRAKIERLTKAEGAFLAEVARLRAEGETSAALARLYGEAKDRAQAENERLRALIERHNDECRECPVVE
jgi:hypothetical protein